MLNYNEALQYWHQIPPTVDGMLGGLGKLTTIDIQFSKSFLHSLLPKQKLQRALDCGAGIGRVTRDLLLEYAEHVDLLEPNSKFLEEAKVNFGSNSRIDYICQPLQDFQFNSNVKYDLIWAQWVLSQLTDLDLFLFLQRLFLSQPQALFIMKENVLKMPYSRDQLLERGCHQQQSFWFDSSFYVLDKEDQSICRSLSHFEFIIETAGGVLIKKEYQTKFPKELYPVIQIAVRSKNYQQ